MEKIAIVTDSNSGITQEEGRRLGILPSKNLLSIRYIVMDKHIKEIDLFHFAFDIITSYVSWKLPHFNRQSTTCSRVILYSNSIQISPSSQELFKKKDFF